MLYNLCEVEPEQTLTSDLIKMRLTQADDKIKGQSFNFNPLILMTFSSKMS